MKLGLRRRLAYRYVQGRFDQLKHGCIECTKLPPNKTVTSLFYPNDLKTLKSAPEAPSQRRRRRRRRSSSTPQSSSFEKELSASGLRHLDVDEPIITCHVIQWSVKKSTYRSDVALFINLLKKKEIVGRRPSRIYLVGSCNSRIIIIIYFL